MPDLENLISSSEKPFIDFIYVNALLRFASLQEIVQFIPSSPTKIVPCIERDFNLTLISLCRLSGSLIEENLYRAATEYINIFYYKKMARLKRFELQTHCLEGSCSIQLSYRRMVGVVRFELTTTRSQSECATRLRYTPRVQILKFI